MERPSVGTSLPRVDGVAKVTGRALYLDDLDAPGAWHGATVRSKIARGVLEAIERDLDRRVPTGPGGQDADVEGNRMQ